MSELPVAPNNVDAEKALLGSIIIDPDIIYMVRGNLVPSQFYGGKGSHNGIIYAAMLKLAERKIPMDLVALANELKKTDSLDNIGGMPTLVDLLNTVPTATMYKQYLQIVLEKATRRNIINAASIQARLAYDEETDIRQVVSGAQVAFRDATDGLLRDSRTIKDIAGDVIDTLLADEKIERIPTGYIDFDRIFRGFHKTQLIYVAARPGMGKTSLLLNMAYHMADLGKRVAFFSLEMSDQELICRLASSAVKVEAERISDNQLSEFEKGKVIDVLAKISEMPIQFVQPNLVKGWDGTPLSLEAEAFRMMMLDGLDVVFVDYIQLMEANGTHPNGNERMGSISRGLKMAAMNLKVPVIAASQLNRAVEKRKNKRPVMSDLRDSGSLEQDANTILFIYRDDYYTDASERPNIAEINVAKNRNGSTGVVDLYWQGQYTSFKNLQRQEIAL